MKKGKKTLIILLAIVALIAIFVFGISQTLIYHDVVPAHVYTILTAVQHDPCLYSNSDYKYQANMNAVMGDYKQKINVYLLTDGSQWDGINSNSDFIKESVIRYGLSNNGLRIANITEGLPPQIRCDNVAKDCNYGFTTEDWELKSDGLCYVKEVDTYVYHFENNSCSNIKIKPSERTENDYDSSSNCEARIIVIPVENETITSSNQSDESQSNQSFIDKIVNPVEEVIDESGNKVIREKTSYLWYLVPIAVLVGLVILVRKTIKRRKR